MRVKARIALLGLLVLPMLVGCYRVKGFASFESATTPIPPKGTWAGDPYANGGIADATGGVKTATNYGKGAKTGSSATANPGYDQPTKGSGLQPGENNGQAKPGFGTSNAPALQQDPGQYSPSAPHIRN